MSKIPTADEFLHQYKKSIGVRLISDMSPEQVANYAKEFVKLHTATTLQEFKFPGYMSSEAQEFFKGNSFEEAHPNVRGVSGTFVKLKDGSTHLPFRNEVFIKDLSTGAIWLK